MVEQLQLPLLYSIVQILHHLCLVDGQLLQFSIEKPDTVFSRRLRFVHRHVGLFEQTEKVASMVEEGDPYADAEVELSTVDNERSRDLFSYFSGDYLALDGRLFGIALQIGKQNDKFVAAEPGYDISGPHKGGETFGQLLEQMVPYVVPHRVVDLFEVVEVQKEERIVCIVALGAHHRDLYMLEEQFAPRKAGQFVVVGEIVGPLPCKKLLRHVAPVEIYTLVSYRDDIELIDGLAISQGDTLVAAVAHLSQEVIPPLPGTRLYAKAYLPGRIVLHENFTRGARNLKNRVGVAGIKLCERLDLLLVLELLRYIFDYPDSAYEPVFRVFESGRPDSYIYIHIACRGMVLTFVTAVFEAAVVYGCANALYNTPVDETFEIQPYQLLALRFEDLDEILVDVYDIEIGIVEEYAHRHTVEYQIHLRLVGFECTDHMGIFLPQRQGIQNGPVYAPRTGYQKGQIGQHQNPHHQLRRLTA